MAEAITIKNLNYSWNMVSRWKILELVAYNVSLERSWKRLFNYNIFETRNETDCLNHYKELLHILDFEKTIQKTDYIL